MNDIIARKIALSEDEHWWALRSMQLAYKKWRLGNSLDLFELAHALNAAAADGARLGRRGKPGAA